MGGNIRRTFVVGDLVTIAPDFRNTIMDFDFDKYIGVVLQIPEENEYIIYWTTSPINNYYKGMWSGDHLVRVEDYETVRQKLNRLHIMNI
jgi:hypothetical protein